MNFFIFTLVIFFTSLSMACPKLSGAYDCKRFIQGYEVDYEVENNVWEFQINGQNYLADDITHSLTRRGVTGTYKSRCIGKSNYHFYQEFTNNETGSAQTETSEFYIKNGDASTVYVDQYFTFGGDDGFALSINDVCKRED